MPMFGAHLSIAGGFHKAVEAAAAMEMDTVQLFTASPQSWVVSAAMPSGNGRKWQAKELAGGDIEKFRAALKSAKLKFPTAHDSYLINLASPEPPIFERSLEAFRIEVERAEALGLAYLVMHPGAATDGDDEAGLSRVVRALDDIHERCPRCRVKVLLETTAGQGRCLGWRFEHLAFILERVKESNRLGVCLDTCHVFAAGYPLAPECEYEQTMREFDRLIGIKRLKLFHLNDSKKPLGSRIDRHEHVGKGHLGLEPFRLIVNDARFAKTPMILETPKEGEKGEAMDPVNLGVLRRLAEGNG